jgi:predicted Fe-S protein YdhL (DUF1289 family)
MTHSAPTTTNNTYDLRCDGCRRRYNGRGNWEVMMKGGHVVRVICPECREAQENVAPSPSNGAR